MRTTPPRPGMLARIALVALATTVPACSLTDFPLWGRGGQTSPRLCNHNSIMFRAIERDDPTAAAILEFVRPE
jgi:hypothetical protein